MNKKFLNAILFGAMISASTSTFVSCKDYDDDIDQLQMQIDQNASTAASELAAKVAALESQINTLTAAKEDLANQLATAKSEAATAAANALAAANGAQASADAVAKSLSDAAARVAVLETQVNSLNGIVAELQAAKADLNAKVSDLQTQMTAVKADTKANADAIAAANASILAKYTELSNEISKVSSSLGARIDVIDATLNTIQANYATKDELNTKAQELAAMDAQLKAQIETNLNYIKTLQETVKDLASKDAELAAKIEGNYNTLLEKINAITVEQTSMLKSIEALQTTVTTLNNSYSTLASSKADLTYVDNINTQLTTLINSLQQTLKDLTTSDASQASTINTLLQDVSKLKEDVLNLQKLADAAATKEALDAAVADLQGKITAVATQAGDNLKAEIEAVEASVKANADAIQEIKDALDTKADQSALEELAASLLLTQGDVVGINDGLRGLRGEIAAQQTALEEMIGKAEANAKEFAQELANGLEIKITDLDERLGDAEDLLSQLTGIAGVDLSAFITSDELADELTNKLADYITITDFENAFEEEKEALSEKFEEMKGEYDTFKTDIEERIEAEVAKLEGINETLVTLKDAVEILQAKVDALINRVQSIVFVPQYSNVDVPTYRFSYKDGAVNDTMSIKFRLEPAGVAAQVVSMWEEEALTLELEGADALKEATRAALDDLFTIKSVKAEGDFLVVTAENTLTGTDVYPTTLVVSKTSEVKAADAEVGTEAESVVMSKTSDYFNVEPISLNTVLENNAEAITKLLNDTTTYEHITFTAAAEKVEESVGLLDTCTANVTIHYFYTEEHSLANMYSTFYNGDMLLPTVSTDLVILTDKVTGDTDWFTVSETGVKVKTNTVEAIGKKIDVIIADKLYGQNENGEWNVVYKVSYEINEDIFEYTIDMDELSITWPEQNTSKVFEAFPAEAIEAMKYYNLTPEVLYTHLVDSITDKGTNMANEWNAWWTEDLIDGNVTDNIVRFALKTNEEGKIVAMGFANKKNTIYSDGDASYKGSLTINIAHTANITFEGTITLDVPDASEYLAKVPYYWMNDGDNTLNINYAYSELTGKYNYAMPMPEAYLNYDKYVAEDVTYEWSLNDYEGQTLTGIEFTADDSLKITGPIVAGTDTLNINDGKVTFNVVVKSGATVLASHEVDQKIFVTYPVDKFETPDGVTLYLEDLKDGSDAALEVTKAVSLKDNDNVAWVAEGAIVSDADNNGRTTAWGVEKLQFNVVNAVCGDVNVTDRFGIDATTGALQLVKGQNFTKDVQVTIRVSLDYRFEKGLYTEYTVTVTPTAKPVE